MFVQVVISGACYFEVNVQACVCVGLCVMSGKGSVWWGICRVCVQREYLGLGVFEFMFVFCCPVFDILLARLTGKGSMLGWTCCL